MTNEITACVEWIWKTDAELYAAILIQKTIREGKILYSHRCGYVKIPKEFSLYKSDYGSLNINCHGGLTFAGEIPIIYIEDKDWWVGFDCLHYEDEYINHEKIGKLNFLCHGYVKSKEFVISECENLASQIVNLYGNVLQKKS